MIGWSGRRPPSPSEGPVSSTAIAFAPAAVSLSAKVCPVSSSRRQIGAPAYSIADFAEGYSLAQVLTEAGLGFIGLTFWKSATAEMRDYGIDAYLSDLNVAIDADEAGCGAELFAVPSPGHGHQR